MMNTEYTIRNGAVHFVVKNEDGETVQSGMFTEDYNGLEQQEYLAWVAEGNEATVEEKKEDN